MKNNITILIPTHPIPDHPSTKHLDETIENIRRYTDAEILIMFDGVHESLSSRRHQYEQYKEDVRRKRREYGFLNMVEFETHQHQSGMTRRVLDFIETPLVMFCEHDTSPIGDIPWESICAMTENSPEVNCIRFNIFEKIPAEHQYLMLDKQPVTIMDVPVTRTIQWSQRPHIAKTGWYRMVMAKWFDSREKMMIEDRMHSVVQSQYDMIGHDTFGLAIYTPKGNQLRSFHSDARGSDKKIIGDE